MSGMFGYPQGPIVRRLRHFLVFLLPAMAVIGVCCLVWYCVHHDRMQDNPKALHHYYEPELQRYAERLLAGDVEWEARNDYAIPQFLIDHGAKHVNTKGKCVVITFGFMPTDAVP